MTASAALVLGFGLGVLVGGPIAAPLGCWLYERHLRVNDCKPVRAEG